ncbi:DUF4861 domain-containing protein [Labilibacter sediminis]|nr:DUF4861 domain-containing protein [Labilibacter sediminis]
MFVNSFFKMITVACLIFALGSCNCNHNTTLVSVVNTIDIDRTEIVKVDLGESSSSLHDVIVTDNTSGEEVLSQLIDKDKDGVFETIAFQASLSANEAKQYKIKEEKTSFASSEVKTFARFVPERTDDFTWENNRVAFRVYGPKAQAMVEDNIPGGTLSGGVDCWLKKVEYSIIDKWYKGNIDEPGYYHIDHGEGLDNYHVGPSLGCGGTGVIEDGKLITSLNYTAYNVLTNGPLSSEFELGYAPYVGTKHNIQEQKTVSINLNDNFTKFEIKVDGADTLVAGITLHDNLGVVSVDSTSAWASYWTPHKGEELGTSIVVDPKYYAGYSHVVSDVKDKSHLLVHLKVIDGKVEYYAGFAWSGSKQYKNKEDWEDNLTKFSKRISNPLQVEFIP